MIKSEKAISNILNVFIAHIKLPIVIIERKQLKSNKKIDFTELTEGTIKMIVYLTLLSITFLQTYSH